MAGDMLYDRIGEGYASTRRSDPQIRARIHTALGDARRVRERRRRGRIVRADGP